MSRIRPVTARPARQWYISIQLFKLLPNCVKMYHLQYHLLAKAIHIQSLCSQIRVYIHILLKI